MAQVCLCAALFVVSLPSELASRLARRQRPPRAASRPSSRWCLLCRLTVCGGRAAERLRCRKEEQWSRRGAAGELCSLFARRRRRPAQVQVSSRAALWRALSLSLCSRGRLWRLGGPSETTNQWGKLIKFNSVNWAEVGQTFCIHSGWKTLRDKLRKRLRRLQTAGNHRAQKKASERWPAA